MIAGIFVLSMGCLKQPTLSTSGIRQDVVQLIEGGDFLAPVNSNWSNNVAGSKIIAVKGPGFSNALHLEVGQNAGGVPWSFGLHVKTTHLVHLGDTVLIRAYMRASGVGQDPSFHTSLIFEQSSDPFNKLIEAPVTLNSEWKEYRFAASATTQYLPGEAQFTMNLGYGAGSLEIANVHIEDVGDTPPSSLHQTIDYFGGKKPGKDWRGAALARIEKYRKAPLLVQVIDHAGNPIKGATVDVQQTSSEFRFGTAAPASLIVGENSDVKQFQTILARDFNTVTFENDLKWNSLNPPDFTDVDQAISWLQTHHFKIRAHNLVWGSKTYLPAGLWEMSDAEIKSKIEQRVKAMVTRFKDKVYVWDVVNEAVIEHELWDRLGWSEFAQVYKLARQTDPNVKLAYNDYNITEEASAGDGQRKQIMEKVKFLTDAGAPLDMIGMQCHVGVPMTTIPRVIEIVESMAKLGKRLEVTEYDLSVLDDKIHAAYTGDFLTAMFSEPSVDGFIEWGFWEGSHWRAAQGGAMFRKDWTPRPTAAEWEKLVLHDWRTNVELKSDGSGQVKTRAFLGTFQITAKVKTKSATVVTIVSVNKDNTVTLKL